MWQAIQLLIVGRVFWIGGRMFRQGWLGVLAGSILIFMGMVVLWVVSLELLG
jgi:hypothetical protein